jgi:hypothetical protein
MLGGRFSVVVLCAAVMSVSVGAVQLRRGSTSVDTKVDVSIALAVAGQPYHFDGKAECTYAPIASIYGVRAQQWRVEHEGPGALSLTFWRPTGGSGDMFSLNVQSGSTSYGVSTVKTAGGGTPRVPVE